MGFASIRPGAAGFPTAVNGTFDSMFTGHPLGWFFLLEGIAHRVWIKGCLRKNLGMRFWFCLERLPAQSEGARLVCQ